MALRASTRQWRSMVTTTAQNRAFASATAPKFATAVPEGGRGAPTPVKSKFLSADGAPIMIIGGFLGIVICLAAHSLWQQLAYCPSVNVMKQKREMVAEVYDPDVVLVSADKFHKKSFLRKVGNIQERQPDLADPIGPGPFSKSRETETLKSVGVRP